MLCYMCLFLFINSFSFSNYFLPSVMNKDVHIVSTIMPMLSFESEMVVLAASK